MNRVNQVSPKDLLEIPPYEASKVKDKQEDAEKRKLITAFSWNVGQAQLEQVERTRAGRPAVYYINGRQIRDSKYLQIMTRELCVEYGLDLLNVIVDLIIPVGYQYPSLVPTMSELVDAAFKPVETVGQKKLVILVEDYRSSTNESLIEPLLQQFLLKKYEPYLFAPSKYFDHTTITSFCKSFHDLDDEEELSSEKWMSTFATFAMFGFLLVLRATLSFPVIIIHMDQKLNAAVDGFKFFDLAQSEGHKTTTFKNTDFIKDRFKASDDFIVNVLNGFPTILTAKSSAGPQSKPVLASEPCDFTAIEIKDEDEDVSSMAWEPIPSGVRLAQSKEYLEKMDS